MKLRKTPKYQIQNSATQRLKNSPVIYMQELLNNNEKGNHTVQVVASYDS